MPPWWVMMVALLLVAALLAGAGLRVWRLLNKTIRLAREIDGSDAPSLQQVLGYNTVMFFLFVGSAAMFGALWVLVMLAANRVIWQFAPGAGDVATQGALFWAIPAIFLGILHSPILLDPIGKRCFQAYDRLLVFTASRSGEPRGAIGASRLVQVLLVVFSVGAIGVLLVGWTWFVRIDASSITVARPFAFSAETHQADQVAAVLRVARLRAPNGDEVPDDHLVIQFADGSFFRAGTERDGFPPDLRDALVGFAERNGIAVVDQDLYQPRTTP
ncbi:MAG: hypothetical protein ACIARR_05690 [Phycisphaerales bacterium JB059]